MYREQMGLWRQDMRILDDDDHGGDVCGLNERWHK